jgi:hypothetical protein
VIVRTGDAPRDGSTLGAHSAIDLPSRKNISDEEKRR